MEIPPASLVVPRDSPSLVLSFKCLGFDGLIGLPGSDLPDGKTVIMLMKFQLPSGASLHLACLEFHVSVSFRKTSVLGAMVCSVGVQVLDGGVCHPLAVLDGFLQEMAICKRRLLDLHGGDDAGFAVHTDGSGGTTTLLAFGEENLEQALVNLGSVETVELVVPFLRIGLLLRGADVKEHHGGREHVHLGVGVGLLEHLVSY